MVMISDELDRTFAALGHPIRRAILSRLARDGSATISELAEPFDVSLMAISKHCSVLADAGLISRAREGRVRRCTYEPDSVDAAREWIDHHRRHWERQLEALAAYLEEE